jgi:hypothetical protein
MGRYPVQALATEDLAVKSGLGRMEIYSMLAVLGR